MPPASLLAELSRLLLSATESDDLLAATHVESTEAGGPLTK